MTHVPPRGWAVLHDAETITRKRAKGRPVLVRLTSIHSIRPYASGRTRCVIGLPSGWLHTTEDVDHITRLIEEATPSPSPP